MNLQRLLPLLAATALTLPMAACKPDGAAAPAADATPAPAAATAAPEPTTPAEAMPANASPPAEAAADAAMSIPGTSDEIWAEVDKHQAELATVVASGDLSQTHHHAFAIRDLVAALPAHSPTLPAQDAAAMQKSIGFVGTLATRLDEAGDAGDRAEAQSSYAQLAKVLEGITRTK